MTFTKEQLTRIIESADEVITALAGTNDDIHPDNSTKMCAAWDDLNDRNAPPSVVKRLAEMALAGMEAEHKDKAPELSRVIYHFRDWNEGFPIERFKADDVISWMLTNYPPAPKPLTTSDRAELENYRNAQQVVPSVLADFEVWFNGPEAGLRLVNFNIQHELQLKAWNACRAAMLQGKAEQGCKVPDGWVMVPVEPTEDMCNVSHIGVDVYTGLARDDEYYSIGGVCAAKVYRAMLASAPQQESE